MLMVLNMEMKALLMTGSEECEYSITYMYDSICALE